MLNSFEIRKAGFKESSWEIQEEWVLQLFQWSHQEEFTLQVIIIFQTGTGKQVKEGTQVDLGEVQVMKIRQGLDSKAGDSQGD